MTTTCAFRFNTITESIFARTTREAQKRDAINLAQGFPDFDGPRQLIERMHAHLDKGPNQYTRASGHPALVHALSNYSQSFMPRVYHPEDEITVVNGATEGIFCTVMGLVNPTQKILVFEPYYESYLTCAFMAGASLVGVPLISEFADGDDGHWTIDWERFYQAMDDDVALIMLNHPHNPTGKVFKAHELQKIYARAREKNIPVAIDGVYENIVYPPADQTYQHFPAGYSDETIFISAISKTFSFTGFKVGWVFAPKKYMRGIRAAHEAAVFCQAPHMQRGVAEILGDLDFLKPYLAHLCKDFMHLRDLMRPILQDFGFHTPNPEGAYFLMAQKHHASLTAVTDNEMASEIMDRFGVAMLPVSSFFVSDAPMKDWLRVAFCKRPETIERVRTLLKQS